MATGKYKEWLTMEKLQQIKWWASKGLSDEQIATNIGISRKTLYTWVNNHSDIGNAIKKGREVATEEVENALYKKATGYYVDVKKPIKIKKSEFKDGKKVKEYEEVVEVIEQIYIAPETGAQVFWLKNRKKEDWKDKIVAEQEGGINITMSEGIDKYAD